MRHLLGAIRLGRHLNQLSASSAVVVHQRAWIRGIPTSGTDPTNEDADRRQHNPQEYDGASRSNDAAEIKSISSKGTSRALLARTLARLDAVSEEDVRSYGTPAAVDPLSEEIDTEYIDSIAPPPPRLTFNLAALVDNHAALQRLVTLGVDLSHVEKTCPKAADLFSKVEDFDKELGPHIKWLIDRVAVPPSRLGRWLSEFPLLFDVEIANLEVRLEYLRVKKFTENGIRRIILECPRWLSRHTQLLDSKLGLIQREFNLGGQDLRLLVTKFPRVILIPDGKILQTQFSLKEEMGFTVQESRRILLKVPPFIGSDWKNTLQNFDLMHNEHKVEHAHIARSPFFLMVPHRTLVDRLNYLKLCGTLRLDPTEYNYTPLDALVPVHTSDADFAVKYAKTSLDEFNRYLKTV